MVGYGEWLCYIYWFFSHAAQLTDLVIDVLFYPTPRFSSARKSLRMVSWFVELRIRMDEFDELMHCWTQSHQLTTNYLLLFSC
jgi:hypothetical protein